MSDYPIQGKLRIRPANIEQDAQFIRAHAAALTEPELRSVPGYDYLKFWYADFACTDQQWAVLAPELDKRNILATLYEAPLFYAEGAAKEETTSRRTPSLSVARIFNLAALVVLLMAVWLFLTSAIDGVACAAAGVVTLLLVIAVQVYGWLRARWEPVVIKNE
jgi:hypothetical protein